MNGSTVPSGLRGDDHRDLFDAGDERGYGVHEHARRIARPAAGDVDADAAQRGDLLPEEDAALLRGEPGLRDLPPVEVLDGRRGRCDGLEERLADRRDGGLDLGIAHSQVGELRLVERGGVLAQRIVAPLPHVLDDVRRDAEHLGVDAAGPRPAPASASRCPRASSIRRSIGPILSFRFRTTAASRSASSVTRAQSGLAGDTGFATNRAVDASTSSTIAQAVLGAASCPSR